MRSVAISPLAAVAATLRSRPRARCATVVALALALAVPAHATVYKCSGPDGAPVYQDSPCPSGKELRDFDKDPPTVSVMPLLPPGTVLNHETLAAPPPAKPKARNGAKAKGASATATARGAARKFIAPGIYEGEVMARLGAPDMKSSGGARKSARWTYLPAPDDPGTVTTLTFQNGRLVEVERKVVK